MKIQEINRQEAVMLGKELEEAAEKIAAKYGLSVKRGGGKYDGNEYKCNNVTFFVPSSSGLGMLPSKENKLAQMWEMKRGQYGMETVSVGDVFQNPNGETVKLVGWDSKKRKYPVIYTNLTKGGQYKTTPQSFKRIAM